MGDGLTGIILAGGQSRRMGRPKAFLPWGDTTLIEHVMETLRPVVDEVLVVVDHAAGFRLGGVRVVEDLVPGAHALGGVYTGVRAATWSRSFVCGCDAPFLHPKVIRGLYDLAVECDLVIPRTAGGWQPLHAIYMKLALPVLADQLSRCAWDLQSVISKLRVRVVEPAALRLLDPAQLSWYNVNTPEEYRQAQRLAAGRR